jgi:hypothetical protein
VFTCILASSRITRSGSWKTDPSFLRGFCHTWEVLLGVLHDEEKMRSAPRYENGDGEHLAQGSPKRGGAAMTAGGEAWEVLLGVLHDEEKMRSAPRYENGDGEHLAQGSPKRGDMRRRYGDAAALRYSSGGTYGSVSSSSEQGCS